MTPLSPSSKTGLVKPNSRYLKVAEREFLFDLA
jgi:hypothetical protein